MSVNSKMTAIANEIRTLQGSTEKLGLDAMATQVNAANATVDAQASLIAQIQTALSGKGTESVAPQIATGEQKGNGTKAFTASGLGFSPSHVIIAAVNDGSTSNGTQFAYSVGGYVGQASIVSSAGYAYPRFVTFDMGADGFTATITASSSSQIFNTGNTYRWIALA